jgi:antitoxin HicB
MLTYALKLAERYDGMVMATFPDIPEAMALGRDFEEARTEARSALESALGDYAAEGRAFPEPRACGPITVTTSFGMLASA